MHQTPANYHITKYPIRGSKDFRVYIRSSYSSGGKKYKETVEKYPSYDALGEEHGDADAFLKARIGELKRKAEEERESAKQARALTKTILPGKESDGYSDKVRNGASLVLSAAWRDLKIEPFLNSWKHRKGLRIEYSLNDALKAMCFLRVIDPGSKLSDSKKAGRFVEPFGVTLDGLYDSLDRLEELEGELVRKLSRECASRMGGYGEVIYYDCTNFHFECQGEDGEGGLRAYGMEKNHRPDPIVEYGLFVDEKGFPISCGTFRGNVSEKGTLLPLLRMAGEEATSHCIVVADAGLNTAENKETVHNSGRNYVYVQPIRMLSKDLREYASSKEGMRAYGEGGCMLKSRWIKRGGGLEEKLIVRFDPDAERFELAAIEQRLSHVRKFIEDPSLLSYDRCRDGKQYIRKAAFDRRTGELIREKSVLSIDDEKVARDRAYAGFYAFVTDIPNSEDGRDREYIRELKAKGLRCRPKTEEEVLAVAGRRESIEECFRAMKTDMSARPIYVRRPGHIKAHLLTVYVALCLISYLKIAHKFSFTQQRLLDSLRSFDYAEGAADDGTVYYERLFWNEELKEISEKLGLKGMKCDYIEKGEMKKLIVEAKRGKRS